MQISAPVISCFDLFFILVDDCNEVTDYAIVRRNEESDDRVYPVEDIQRYITFARLLNLKVSYKCIF